MFTGNIQGIGKIEDIVTHTDKIVQGISFPESLLIRLKPGVLVTVDGVSLTVINIENHIVYFDITATEALYVTTLGEKKVGDDVNLEVSPEFGKLMGSKPLTGIVSGMAVLQSIDSYEDDVFLAIQVSPELLERIKVGGYLGINGISAKIDSACENIVRLSLRHSAIDQSALISIDQESVVNIEVPELANSSHW